MILATSNFFRNIRTLEFEEMAVPEDDSIIQIQLL